jgi:LDH2 family malate/lactate/ureidoglycolate dehydrogenase
MTADTARVSPQLSTAARLGGAAAPGTLAVMSDRYAHGELIGFATSLLRSAGLAADRAEAVARVFVEADALGFSTHGLRRLPINLDWLARGVMRAQGEPRVLRDRQAVFSWDAGHLPGPWVLDRAVREAIQRVADAGVVTATLRRCTHVACLAAYLLPLLDRDLLGVLVVSTPDERFISPFGAREGVFSNNPIAFCAPASGTSLLFDVSMAITAGGQIARAEAEGRRLPEACLKDAEGRVTDDPAVMHADPPGTVMPIGGAGHGHKGYALTLMTEVLTQALGGHGRSEAVGEGEANSVYLQVIDPAAFTDWQDYLREVDHLLDACRRALPDDPAKPVRVPGEGALARRRESLISGVALYPGIMDALEPRAREAGVALPRPLS